MIPVHETVDSTSDSVVDRVRSAVQHATGSANIGVAGPGAVVQDYFSAVYTTSPCAADHRSDHLRPAGATFRSVLLPIKAVLLNLVSLGAVFGAVVYFWQHGHGANAIFGVSATGAITFWLPVIIFAFLFGLSMDYEVFILVPFVYITVMLMALLR